MPEGQIMEMREAYREIMEAQRAEKSWAQAQIIPQDDLNDLHHRCMI